MEEEYGLNKVEADCLKKCQEAEAECRSLWVRAMEYSPRLAHYCTHWHDFTPGDWAKLLANNIEFIHIAPLHKLGCAEWFIVLSHQPALIEKCSIIDDFPENYWGALLKQYPWFRQYRKKQ